MAPRRDEQPPKPGYAATLMGDDMAQVIKPLAAVMTATAALNVFDMLAPQIGLGLSLTGGMEGATLRNPVLTAARNSIGGPSMASPLTGGPKMFGGGMM